MSTPANLALQSLKSLIGIARGRHKAYISLSTNDVALALDRVKELEQELRNIATADPTKWDPEVRNQFQAWAQTRARHTLGEAE